jgi:DNA-binding NarL/FixJ family response regulator
MIAKPIRVLLVDDHTMVRQGLRSALQPYRNIRNIEIIGEADDGERAMVSAAKLQPDVVAMDVSLPKVDGITATRLIKAQYPHMVVIGLSAEPQDYEVHAMKTAGAIELLRKSNAIIELYAAIQTAVAAVNPVAILEETAAPMQAPVGIQDSAKPAGTKPVIQDPDAQ